VHRQVVFVLPWRGNTLIGTTEVRQTINDPVICSQEEQRYLLDAWAHYFPNIRPNILETFAGVRPILRGAEGRNKATRGYAIYRENNLSRVFWGKWTTTLALAEKVSQAIH